MRALACLARLDGDSFVGAAGLADSVGAPSNYLGKLLQALAQAGLVESRKGSGGGFRLARPATEISLHDVVEIVDTLQPWEGCILGNPICSDESACPVHDRWKSLRADNIRFLTETTIADLAPHVEGDGGAHGGPDG